MENHDCLQICCSKPSSVREPSNLDDHYLCKFVVQNHPLCEEPSNLDDHYPLEISCPKPPSLQGGLQFGLLLSFTNFLSQTALVARNPPTWMIIIFANWLSRTALFARSPPIWMIIIIYKFLEMIESVW